MKTFWHLSEKERAGLSSEDVTAYEAIELMAAGVLPPEPLKLDPEPDCREPMTYTVYRLRSDGLFLDCAFATFDAAQSFLALNPVKVGHSYLGGDYCNSVDYTKALEKTEIVAVELTTEDLFRVARADLEKRSAVRSENKKRKEAFDKANEGRRKALEGMWDDWYRCRGLEGKHRRVIETFDGYVKLAEGSRATAARFLLKAFNRQQVTEAAEWCGITIELPPELDDAGPVPAPETSETADAIAF